MKNKNKNKEKGDIMSTKTVGMKDEEVVQILKDNKIDEQYIGQYFDIIQEKNKKYPQIWKKKENFDYLLSLHKENLKLKEQVFSFLKK